MFEGIFSKRFDIPRRFHKAISHCFIRRNLVVICRGSLGAGKL